MNGSQLLVLLFVGAVAGVLAELLVGGLHLGLIGAIIVGVIGAFVGAWLFHTLGLTIAGGLIGAIITAFVGAAVLLLLFRALRRI